MAKVAITVRGKRYLVNCTDGQEERLSALVGRFDSRVKEIVEHVGPIADDQLYLTAAISLINEVEEKADREIESFRALQSQTAPQAEKREIDQAELDAIEQSAVKVLHETAAKIEILADRLDDISGVRRGLQQPKLKTRPTENYNRRANRSRPPPRR